MERLEARQQRRQEKQIEKDKRREEKLERVKKMKEERLKRKLENQGQSAANGSQKREKLDLPQFRQAVQ